MSLVHRSKEALAEPARPDSRYLFYRLKISGKEGRMANRVGTTLWTSKMSDWTSLLQDIKMSPELERQISASVQGLSEAGIRDRLIPYNTPVTHDALRVAVK